MSALVLMFLLRILVNMYGCIDVYMLILNVNIILYYKFFL